MASCNFAKPAAGARQMHIWLCCVVIVTMAITMKGAWGKTVLYNKSGRDLALIAPHSISKKFPVGQSIELEGAQQQRGVMIQDVESGAVAGPLDLPDNRSLEAVWLDPSTSTAAATTALGRPSLGVSNSNCVGITLMPGTIC